MATTRSQAKLTEAMVYETMESLGLSINKIHRRISWEEVNDRWFKGLCMFCSEPETPDHHLLHKNSGILMIDCDEDQSCDDEELVAMEVGTESTETKHGKEELVPQFQDVLLTKSTGVTTKQVALQLFDKMPSKEKRIKHLKGWSFKFKRKNLMGIMLQIGQYKLMERRRRRYNKFSTNIKDESMRVLITGNHRRMVRQLHISRVQCKRRMMNDSWNMRRLTLKVMKSHMKHKWKSKQLQIASNFWINHPQELVELVLRTSLMEQDTSLPRVDWGTKNLAPFIMQYIVVQEMVSMQDNETITKTYSGQLHELHDTTGATNTKQELSYWSVAKHVKRDGYESFGSKGLAYNGCVILEMNFAGFERGKTELLAFIHMKVIETRYAIRGRDEMLEVARDVSKRSMLGLTFGIRETNAGEDQRAVCELIIKVNEWLQTSLVIRQVMKNKKFKFSKRWWFKYRFDEEEQGSLQSRAGYSLSRREMLTFISQAKALLSDSKVWTERQIPTLQIQKQVNKSQYRWTQVHDVDRCLMWRHLHLKLDCEEPKLAGRKRDHGLFIRLHSKQKQRKCPKSWMFKFKTGSKLAGTSHLKLHKESGLCAQIRGVRKQSKLLLLSLCPSFLCRAMLRVTVKQSKHPKTWSFKFKQQRNFRFRDVLAKEKSKGHHSINEVQKLCFAKEVLAAKP